MLAWLLLYHLHILAQYLRYVFKFLYLVQVRKLLVIIYRRMFFTRPEIFAGVAVTVFYVRRCNLFYNNRIFHLTYQIAKLHVNAWMLQPPRWLICQPFINTSGILMFEERIYFIHERFIVIVLLTVMVCPAVLHHRVGWLRFCSLIVMAYFIIACSLRDWSVICPHSTWRAETGVPTIASVAIRRVLDCILSRICFDV